MCIIIYTPDGHIPKKHLKNSLDNNSDGWGVMWTNNGQVMMEKGLSKHSFYRCWKSIGKLNTPKVFHARIGTHGGNTLENCHPFSIPGHENIGVVHNGILSAFTEGTVSQSDTRNFIDRILSVLPQGFLDNKAIMTMLADFIGVNKLVFLDGKNNVHLVNGHLGGWNENRWYSNNSYIGWLNYTKKHQTTYYDGRSLGFSSTQGAVKQDNFPVFKEDERQQPNQSSCGQHSTYDDYDKMDDEQWKAAMDRHGEFLGSDKEYAQKVVDRHSCCGIGVPAAVLGEQKADAEKTGIACIEDISARKERLKQIRRILKDRYPEDSEGAINWRMRNAYNNQTEYPCELPDPAEKYKGYTGF